MDSNARRGMCTFGFGARLLDVLKFGGQNTLSTAPLRKPSALVFKYLARKICSIKPLIYILKIAASITIVQ